MSMDLSVNQGCATRQPVLYPQIPARSSLLEARPCFQGMSDMAQILQILGGNLRYKLIFLTCATFSDNSRAGPGVQGIAIPTD
jgi:hypothetical protein